MIISKANQFFWAKVQKKFLFLAVLCLFASCGKKENLSLKSLKTATGWGYSIAIDGKTVIKQTVIPVISDNKSFETEEEALKIGNLVLDKLKKDLSPTVTKKDLILLEIKI